MTITLDRMEFINQYPPFALMKPSPVETLFTGRPAHLYVHLPFCKHKCGYCFFKSFENHDRPYVDGYLSALKAEIDIYCEMPAVRTRTFKSLYFGGGTPTLLQEDQLEDIVRYIQDRFSFAPGYELCVEANPDTQSLSDSKLRLLKELGVRRLSFGVQSFNDDILRLNDRVNTTAAFHERYSAARAHGFDVVNIDIMSGLYGETRENWDATIDTLLRIRPDSIAFYKLELYFNTKLYKQVRRKDETVPLITNDEEIELISKAYERLQDEGGYSVSNCFILISAPDKEHVHRKGVWNGEEMLGLGLSAHSCFNGHLYQNTLSMQEYREILAKGDLPIRRAHRCTVEDEISTAMVYGIKNLRIDRAAFMERFGVDAVDIHRNKIELLVAKGLLSVDDDTIAVPRSHYIFADDIARQFFLPKYNNMMLAHHMRSGDGAAA